MNNSSIDKHIEEQGNEIIKTVLILSGILVVHTRMYSVHAHINI
jgi:RNA 3'-terminal phosphate cyclase